MRAVLWATIFIVTQLATHLSADEPHSVPEVSLPAGINDDFKSDDLSVDQFVKLFEIESREVYGQRHEILKLLDVKPGQNIIDLGAGTGFYTFMLAEAVGAKGEVLAIDIAPAFVDAIQDKADKHGINNVQVRRSSDIGFEAEPGKYDLVLVCDVYHHFEYPHRMNTLIAKSLRPGGRLVVIDFKREEGKSRQWVLDHVRAGEDIVRAEIQQSGLKFKSSNTDLLTEDYILTFQKDLVP